MPLLWTVERHSVDKWGLHIQQDLDWREGRNAPDQATGLRDLPSSDRGGDGLPVVILEENPEGLEHPESAVDGRAAAEADADRILGSTQELADAVGGCLEGLSLQGVSQSASLG